MFDGLPFMDLRLGYRFSDLPQRRALRPVGRHHRIQHLTSLHSAFQHLFHRASQIFRRALA